MFDALAFGREAAMLVEAVRGAIQGLVGAAQVGRHQLRVVEISQRGVRPFDAGVQDGLREIVQL